MNNDTNRCMFILCAILDPAWMVTMPHNLYLYLNIKGAKFLSNFSSHLSLTTWAVESFFRSAFLLPKLYSRPLSRIDPDL